MKKTLSILIHIFVTLMFVGCQGNDELTTKPRLVVEGWIDDGGFPVVMLTTTVNISKEYQDIDSLQNHLLRWAKVTVSNGEETIVLTGAPDREMFPPYTYSSAYMRGEAGKTYTMTAQYEDFYAEASTTIPASVPVDSFVIERSAVSDTLYTVKAYFTDNSDTHDYYMFFTRVNGHTEYYLMSHFGVVDDAQTKNPVGVDIYPGTTLFDEEYVQQFHYGDTVYVKFAHIDETSYNFWRDHETAVMIGRNPLFPVINNLRSNIQGGLGYWFGYGAKEYRLFIPKKEKRVVIVHPSSLGLSN